MNHRTLQKAACGGVGIAAALIALAIAGCATPALDLPSAAALAELAPKGSLRVTLILANPVQATKDPKTGELHGPAIDLARSLANRLGVPLETSGVGRAEEIVAGAGSDKWDVAFLAIDRERSSVMDFSRPYLEALNTCLVPAGSGIRTLADIDRPGVRIGVGQGDAIDLHFTRTLKHAQLVRTTGGLPAALELIKSGRADAYVANTHRLLELSARLPGSRVLDGSVLAAQQAIAVPKGRSAGLAYVNQFLAQARTSGFVQRSIERANLRGVKVAAGAAADVSATSARAQARVQTDR